MSIVEDRQCSECGSDDLREIEGLEKDYPERRRERDRTVRRVVVCQDCDGEGRIFEDGMSSNVQLTGILR